MAASDAAYQRRNRVLAESSRRLSSLSKPEYDDDEETQPPSSFLKEVILSSPRADVSATAKVVEPIVKPLDLASTRCIAVCNLLSYVLSFSLGCYVCHVLHSERVDSYCPAFVRGFFSLIDMLGAARMIHMAISAWLHAPERMKHTTVKVLTYGSVILNIYPIWASMRKGGSAGQTEDSNSKDEADSSDEDSDGSDDGSGGNFFADFDEENLAKIAMFVIRSGAACLVFGLLGYDILYNMPLILQFIH
ncbi:iron-sulfur cluster-binding Rieske family protein, putative [Babesia ovata]|uniref:Iron-sulfur cluster-binding Rieske family protein, putative n=1 Tax=Babesia ovata TaxID=189622 RepID=A0A2H6KFH4_9APIC|nr:iron-sulfur cluster-binding Rieske family protein, putative [Babesia ovata]GBE61737.1 iron-sulfur cluster-binding Rieske family protein, putative [Babesia ovata]